MGKYLYGAAVQGIQQYILRTNKLKDIVSASGLVADICTRLFVEQLGLSLQGAELENYMRNNAHFILHAAGNIKYIFDTEDACKRVVLNFPRKIMEVAPGITISQAVVKYEDNDSFLTVVNELESKLRIQRNMPARSQTLGLMGIARSRQTGLPAFISTTSRGKGDNDNLIIKAFGEEYVNRVVYQIDQFTKEDNDWVAVIHADGNGLGRIVQKIGGDETRFKHFSENLDIATTEAARAAFHAVMEKGDFGDIPIRPIVLGGDDLTVVCRADLALDYTKTFIAEFEKKTCGLFEGIPVFVEGPVRDRMTACAGIAYVKASYPFYYAYGLAESLCSAAKKDAKNNETINSGRELPPSCIMFHKVQDSFNETYDSIVSRELKPTDGISLQGGPYYLHPKQGRRTVDELENAITLFANDEMNPVRSTVREWLSSLYENKGIADQLLQRAKMLYTGAQLSALRKATDVSNGSVLAYDILVIDTINNQSVI